MRRREKHNLLMWGTPLIVISAVVFTWILASLDAFEWFYWHSRQFEAFFDYDEIVFSLFFFLAIGMFWLSFYLYKKAHSVIEAEGPTSQDSFPRFLESLKEMKHPLAGARSSPLLLVLALILLIGVVELLDMLMLYLLPSLPAYVEALIDAGFLMLMISPALYFLFLRPLLRQVHIREQAEEALKQFNLQLEQRVEQRTAQLYMELDKRKRTEARLVKHQKELRSLSSELAVVEKRERYRIATDLHDNIGHALAMMNNRLGVLKASLTTEEDRKSIDDTRALIAEAIRYSRSLSSELGSPLMNTLPFVSAVKVLADDILKAGGITYHLKTDCSPDLPAGNTRIIFIKAVQEMLVNVIKHAKARTVDITVRAEIGDIIVEIKDDGTGFDASSAMEISPTNRGGWGLFTVRERMASLNGTFSITSTPGRGTTAVLTVPIQGGREEKAAWK